MRYVKPQSPKRVKLKELMPGLDGSEIVLPKYPEKLLFQQYFVKKSEDITTSKYCKHPKQHIPRRHLLVNVNRIHFFMNQPENHFLQKQVLQYKIYLLLNNLKMIDKT